MTLVPLSDFAPTTDTAPSGGGRKPFPCDGHTYTRHTAKVVKAGILTLDSGDCIKMTVENGQHGGDILINLDCSGAPNPQRATETRNKAISLLGAHTNGQLDTAKLEKASGQLVTISARHKGFSITDKGTFHKVALYFEGGAAELTPVQSVVTMPPIPGEASTDDPFTF